MVHALADAPRPTRLVYSVKDAAHHAFKDELAALARRSPWLTVVPVYTRAEGRLTPARLQPFVQTTDMDCLVCGPAPFMSAMTEALEGLGVRRIWQESF
jgi:ferredoxin-NADP reductase